MNNTQCAAANSLLLAWVPAELSPTHNMAWKFVRIEYGCVRLPYCTINTGTIHLATKYSSHDMYTLQLNQSVKVLETQR